MPRTAASQLSAEATKRRLVEVSLPMFAESGFRGASVRDIAMVAKVNHAMISHHFGDKLGLYNAVVDEVYRRLAARTGEAFAGAALADVDALIEKLYAVARAERDGVRVLVRQVLDHGHLTPFTETKHFLPSIEQATRSTADLLGIPVERARVAAVSLGYLLSRFVIQDERSLMSAFGVRSVKAAHARVVETLTASARALFAVAPAPPKEWR